ncbi:hypothetical protein [uncultured Brevundimonas sp.]|uniref:hypothetical protein n=1 Tax=uncultured Brevundimonas sp. TaxID=213418 RepID=UPI0030EB2A12|tara:strand:+ start:23711 stop:24604 length:894 start_codon:yes stop_codon:yes gene_type:complete
MALPSEAKFFADLSVTAAENDAHLLALQQGSPPVGGATPTPTRKWSLLALRTWLQNHFVRGPAAVTADRLALFDGTTGRLLKQAGGGIGPGLTQVPTGQDLVNGLTQSGGGGDVGTFVAFFISNEESNRIYLLLARANSGDRVNGTAFLGVNGLDTTAVNRSVRLDIFIATSSGSADIVSVQQSSGSSAGPDSVPFVKLLTVDVAGTAWYAVKTNSFVLRRVGFVGRRNNDLSTDFLSAKLAAELTEGTELSVLGNGVSFAGRPGDSIGGNQSLHIAGNPGTTKAVFVDANGFIKEV